MKSLEELEKELKLASNDCEKLRKDLHNRESDLFSIQNAIFTEQKRLREQNATLPTN